MGPINQQLDVSLKEIEAIFDAEYYLTRYPDVARANIDPLMHFYEFGFVEGRSPNAKFEPAWYDSYYKIARKFQVSPLRHYLDIGCDGGFYGTPNFYIHRRLIGKHLPEALKEAQVELISVIMTVKNPPDGWLGSISSVLGQSYRNWELLIIQDCGGIESDGDLSKHLPRDDRITNHISKKPGRASALNEGVALSSGRWIAYLDVDNWWDAHYLLLMHHLLLKSNSRVGYCGNLQFSGDDIRSRFRLYDADALACGPYIDLNSLMHSADIFTHNIKFNERLTRLIDYEFILSISAQISKIESFPLFLTYYDNLNDKRRITISESFEDNLEIIRESQAKGELPSLNFGVIKSKELSNLELDCQPIKISVVIVNFNGATFLPGLLDSLMRQSFLPYEIIIVDNSSTDDSVNLIQEQYFKVVKLVKSAKNLGFAEGSNLGASHATGELLAFLNSDTEVESDWLKFLAWRYFQSESLELPVGAITSKILFFKKFINLSFSIKTLPLSLIHI